MLIGIDPLLSPELLMILRAVGHGDEIVIVDANFPALANAKRLVRLDGIDSSRALQAILSVMPLDSFVEAPANGMQVVGRPDEIPPAIADFQSIVDRLSAFPTKIARIERFGFYDRAKTCFAVVATGDRRLYANIILTKGVIGADGKVVSMSRNGMMAVVCRKPGELAIEERPLPERRPGEVLLAIRRIGICGTDYHIFEGLHPFLQYPRVMGHELSAEVLEAPAGSEYRLGDPVIVIPYLTCGTCIACRKGKTNCCTTLKCLGVHCDGGMAERFSLPEENLYPAAGLTLDQAAMVEFLAIGAHAVRRSQAAAGERALVVGAGPIGIGTALFARLGGAEVTLMDRVPAALEVGAKIAGSIASVVADEHAPERLKDMTGGELFDVVFDATGNAGAMERSFDFAASGGRYVMVGVVKDRLAFCDAELHRKELTLLASRNATRGDFDTVVAAMRAGKIPTDAIGTHACALEELPTALPRWAHDRVGVVKAMAHLPGELAA